MDPNEPFDQPVPMTPDPSAEPPKSAKRAMAVDRGRVGAAVLVVGAAFIGMQASKSDSSGSSTTADPNASAAEQLERDHAARPGARHPGHDQEHRRFDADRRDLRRQDRHRHDERRDHRDTDRRRVGRPTSRSATTSWSWGRPPDRQTEAERIVDTGSQDIGNGFGRGGAPGQRFDPRQRQLPWRCGTEPAQWLPVDVRPRTAVAFTPPVIGTVTAGRQRHDHAQDVAGRDRHGDDHVVDRR